MTRRMRLVLESSSDASHPSRLAAVCGRQTEPRALRDQRAVCFCVLHRPPVSPTSLDRARSASPTARSSRAGFLKQRMGGQLPSAARRRAFRSGYDLLRAPLRLRFTRAVADHRPKPWNDPSSVRDGTSLGTSAKES